MLTIIKGANDMSKLVSILSPCYNGEKYLKAFLDSVLCQTYDNIELIVINDGSTDQTEKILESYKEKFEEAEYRYIVLNQENAGQAAAINKGLKVFSGEYLTWVDSDDVLLETNIEEKVNFLENNSTFGFVLAQGMVVSDENYEVPLGIIKRTYTGEKDNLFEDLINEKNVVYGPGTIMVRRSSVVQAIPSLNIFECKEGQNWQLILPLAYTFRCGYIDKPLFKYVKHSDSHSRVKRTHRQEIARIKRFIEMLTKTIESIPGISDSEIQQYEGMVHLHFYYKILMISYRAFYFFEATNARKKLKKIGAFGYRYTYICYLLGVFGRLYKKIIKNFRYDLSKVF